MGLVLGASALTTADASNVGDLVLFAWIDARAVGFVLEFDKGLGPLLGVLSSVFGVPRLLRIRDDTPVVNYGRDWVLEPIDSPTVMPERVDANRRAGLLTLTRDGWFMNFASSSVDQLGHFSWEWRDLEKFIQVSHLGNGVVFDEWKLWSISTDRDHPDRQPLVSYKAKRQTENPV